MVPVLGDTVADGAHVYEVLVPDAVSVVLLPLHIATFALLLIVGNAFIVTIIVLVQPPG